MSRILLPIAPLTVVYISILSIYVYAMCSILSIYVYVSIQMTDEALLELCMSRVACLAVRGRPVPRPSRMVRTRWATDPFSLGAYSYWAKGNEPGAFVDRY
jgi:hypothetical protein